MSGLKLYETVYDLQSEGYAEWWFPAFGLAMVILLVVILCYNQKLGKWRNSTRAHKRLQWLALGFPVVWTIWAIRGTYLEYRKLSAIMNEGNVSMVSGRITNFDPMPTGGHRDESFRVNGERFSYSDYSVSPGFKKTAVHGGPLREGLFVRVTHINGVIVRLEIAK